MTLPPEAFYLPFEAGPHRMTMGLVARTPDDLIELDEHYPDELAQRRHHLAEQHAEVLAALPGTEPACAVVLERIARLLPRRYPDHFTRADTTLDNRLTGERWNLATPGLHPLDLAGRLVQEDLCILRLVDGNPVLVAGVVCFPTAWRLVEKLGLPLADVHGPVPLYKDRLARPVDRLMTQLRPGKLVERLNWGLYDSPALFRPGSHFRHERNPAITPENAGDRTFLRVERQTLSAIDGHDAVLFTIRTHVYPVARVAAVAAPRLAAAIRALPPTMALYKSVAPFAEPLLAYLDLVADA